ncbi:MAG: hypothetical protein LWX07_04200 [Bacteroidetes bacterium]|nr:hypothetical protein [Bacteroidota bacterium]
MKKLLILLIMFISVTAVLAQNGKTVNDKNYKFSITLGDKWATRNTVETNKKDVITYSFDRSDGKLTLSLIAFKFAEARNLDDFVYTLEKDFNLNIPEKVGGYTDISGDNFKGKWADYRDNDSHERIYYYATTQDSSGDYFCYMLRFIADAKTNVNDIKAEVVSIADSFKIKL